MLKTGSDGSCMHHIISVAFLPTMNNVNQLNFMLCLKYRDLASCMQWVCRSVQEENNICDVTTQIHAPMHWFWHPMLFAGVQLDHPGCLISHNLLDLLSNKLITLCRSSYSLPHFSLKQEQDNNVGLIGILIISETSQSLNHRIITHRFIFIQL